MSCCREWHTHITLKAGRKRPQRHFICSCAPIEFVCFSHQSVLFSVLFNLFTFGPYWRGTVHWFIVPQLPESGVKSAQGPPVLRPCSYIVVAGLLASVSETGRGKARLKLHKDLTGKKKEKSLSGDGLRDGTVTQCGFMWIADLVGPLPTTEGWISSAKLDTYSIRTTS